jgi:hypothetical protein
MLYNISSSSHIIKNQMASPALLFSICCCCWCDVSQIINYPALFIFIENF